MPILYFEFRCSTCLFFFLFGGGVGEGAILPGGDGPSERRVRMHASLGNFQNYVVGDYSSCVLKAVWPTVFREFIFCDYKIRLWMAMNKSSFPGSYIINSFKRKLGLRDERTCERGHQIYWCNQASVVRMVVISIRWINIRASKTGW